MKNTNEKNAYQANVKEFNNALKEEKTTPIQAIKILLSSEFYINSKETQKYYLPFFGSGKPKDKINNALKVLNHIAPKNDKGEFVRLCKGEKITKKTFSAFWVLQQAYKYIKTNK